MHSCCFPPFVSSTQNLGLARCLFFSPVYHLFLPFPLLYTTAESLLLSVGNSSSDILFSSLMRSVSPFLTPGLYSIVMALWSTYTPKRDFTAPPYHHIGVRKCNDIRRECCNIFFDSLLTTSIMKLMLVSFAFYTIPICLPFLFTCLNSFLTLGAHAQ